MVGISVYFGCEIHVTPLLGLSWQRSRLSAISDRHGRLGWLEGRQATSRQTRTVKLLHSLCRQQRLGTESAGLVASSSAQRLKPRAGAIRVSTDPVHRFLDFPNDARSSRCLGGTATDFQVQRLEHDWTIVTWVADLRRTGSALSFHSLRGEVPPTCAGTLV
jgi:hypothetical protein